MNPRQITEAEVFETLFSFTPTTHEPSDEYRRFASTWFDAATYGRPNGE